MLLALRASVVALEDEEKRLCARLESLAADRAAARRRLPWQLRPGTGAGIAIGALAGAAAELVLTGTIHVAAPLAAGTGGLWTLAALASTGRAGANDTRHSLLETIRRARRQRAVLERQIAQLEE
jgi:predicted lysophospholipase L1 biosynthesis ABC-type transport system permease subunit